MRLGWVGVIITVLLLSLVAYLPATAQNGVTPVPAPEPTTLPIAPAPAPPPARDVPGMDPKLQLLADQQINDVLLQLERVQTARRAVNAPLLQLAPTHKQPPNTLAGVAPNLRARVGIDSWWSSAIDLPAAMVASVRVDVYDGPQGAGYVIIARAGAFERRVNVGPESWREQDWRPR